MRLSIDACALDVALAFVAGLLGSLTLLYSRAPLDLRASMPSPRARIAPRSTAPTGAPDRLPGRRLVLTGVLAPIASWPLAGPAASAPDPTEQLQALQRSAVEAYTNRELPEAERLFGRLIALDEENAALWYERRGSARLDLKAFAAALADFDTAQRLQGPRYRSLELISDRALAYEGLARWADAERDYTEAIALAAGQGFQQPYALNSRGNARASLGRWAEAREDYLGAARAFQAARNLNGAIYAQSNAALCLVQLGDDAGGTRELLNAARRGPGSLDTRAALAAMFWHAGDRERAEEYWGFACTRLNSGVMVKGGPSIDGCARYRDSDWLTRIRRWPPVLVQRMEAFLAIQQA